MWKNIMLVLVMMALFIVSSCKKIESGKAEITENKQVLNSKKSENKQVENISLEDDKELMLNVDKAKLKSEINGKDLKLFLIAYESFKNENEISDEKKKVENYTIKVYENNKYFYVKFTPNISESDINIAGGETDLGKEVEYTIDKKTLKVLARFFGK